MPLHHLIYLPPAGTCDLNDSVAPWAYTYFGECVEDELQYVGFILGLVSILMWMIVFLPQFYESYKTGRADEALSPMFLIMWLLGDISNLVGCILTNQLATQKFMAYYYIFMDFCILSQYAYYYFKNKRRTVKIDANSGHVRYGAINSNQKHVIYIMGATFIFMSGSLFSLLPWQHSTGSLEPFHGRTLLSYSGEKEKCLVYWVDGVQCMFYDDTDLIGYIIGIISGLCYFLSRSPQILKNYQRKSVEGVSMFMFVITVLGNLTYGLSVIFEDTSILFLLRHLPWLVGSIGTLLFDATQLLAQFGIYGRNSPSEERRLLA